MKKNNAFDLIVVGGGLVGLASAYKIQKEFPKKNILVIEKEKDLAFHQSGRNSGVLHSGLYYKPGSYRAKNCVLGREELVAYAKKNNIKHDVCGKIVIAVNQEEVSRLPALLETGVKNGLNDLKIINRKEILDIEPFADGLSAIWVPQTGIIDYKGVANSLATNILKINSNSSILKGCKFLDCKESIIFTNKGEYEGKNVIFCGGLFSDRLAKKDNVKLDLKIVSFRGEYYQLKQKSKHKIKNLVYPVPNPEFPFLGVHFTRMTTGEIECGPNAVFTFKREGYNKTDFSIKDTMDALTYTGTWQLFRKHWKFGLNEMLKAGSKSIFLKHLQKIIPSLTINDIISGRSGVRAMALGRQGNVIDDFRVVRNNNNIHVLNAPSPAATACLSIGETVSESFLELLN